METAKQIIAMLSDRGGFDHWWDDILEEDQKDILEAITHIVNEAEKNAKEVLDKLDHEQRKFLDGFAHPKDCPDCLTPPPQ